MADFSKLALLSDRPFRVLLKLPDGEPLKDKDGKQAYVDVISSDSHKAKEYGAACTARIQRGEKLNERETRVGLIAHLTTDWYLLRPDGEPLLDDDKNPVGFSVEAAKNVYQIDGADFIFDQAAGGVFNRVNFMPERPKGS